MKKIELIKTDFPDGFVVTSDVNICETAGFVDLETRFKRLEQSGYVAQFFAHQFDVNDMREIYLGEDTAIYADDDEVTVRKKLALQDKLRMEIQKSILDDLGEVNDETEAPQGRGSNEVKPSSQRSSEKEEVIQEDS